MKNEWRNGFVHLFVFLKPFGKATKSKDAKWIQKIPIEESAEAARGEEVSRDIISTYDALFDPLLAE